VAETYLQHSRSAWTIQKISRKYHAGCPTANRVDSGRPFRSGRAGRVAQTVPLAVQFDYWIRAKFSSLAVNAMFTKIQGVDPVHELCQLLLIVEQKSSFKVSFMLAFGAHASPCQVGRSDKSENAVDNDGFGMNSRTQDSFKQFAVYQGVKAIKFFAKSRPWFFCVYQPHRDAGFNQRIEGFKQWQKAEIDLYVQILDIGCNDPKELPRLG
jgi:hypothetical protein